MEGEKMKKLNFKLKDARIYLGLTQEDVAKLMELNRNAIISIENGSRKVSAEELAKFSKIYGWSMEELMEENVEDNMVPMFARTFNELSDKDKQEILNLIKFKRMYQEENNE
jgi:DNA-binding XRE family transcriptional regulator